MLYRSLDQLTDSENRTLLELFVTVHGSPPRRYPLIPSLELSSKFGVAKFETESRLVTLSHAVPDKMHKIQGLDPSKESADNIIV